MDIKQIDQRLSVSPQIATADLATLRTRGFRAVICNRPDHEGDQPRFSEIAAAAKAQGMEARYIPVTPGAIGASDVAAFAAAMRELPGPVLAYCRSGARSSMLWSQASATL